MNVKIYGCETDPSTASATNHLLPVAGKEGDNHFRRKFNFTRQPLPVLCCKCVCSARGRLSIWFGGKFTALLSIILNVSKGEFAYEEKRQF
jgi:hypothetical protein